MITKRAVITLVIPVVIFAHVAEAQTKKIPRIGWLSVAHGPTIYPSFIQGLRDLGWFVDKNIAIEARFAQGEHDQFPRLAAELVQMKVDVIVAADAAVIRAAKNATRTIPIVMAIISDPVSAGHVGSIARPGGNITGLSNDLGPLDGKRLQILKETVPSVSFVAIPDFRPDRPCRLENDGNCEACIRNKVTKVAEIQTFQRARKPVQRHPDNSGERALNRVEGPSEFERAFAEMTRERANAVIVLPDAMFFSQRDRIVHLATSNRLPVMYTPPWIYSRRRAHGLWTKRSKFLRRCGNLC